MAAAYYTFQSFMEQLLTVLKSHQQVNSVHYGLLSDMSNPKVPNTIITYPYIFVMVDSLNVPLTNVGMNITTVNVDLIICDQYQDNESAIYQIQSNMFEIMRDIISVYSNPGPIVGGSYRIPFPQNIKIHNFVERGSDNVAGVEATIPFQLEQPLSRLYPLTTGE